MLRNHAIRAVEEQDPSLELGYEIIYDKSLSLEFRNFERQEAESRLVHLRVLVKKEGRVLTEVRFEMFDDADLFFFIEATITGDDFEKLKQEDQLLLEFAFINEVIDHMQLAPLRYRLHYLVEKRFRGELSKCEGCKLCK